MSKLGYLKIFLLIIPIFLIHINLSSQNTIEKNNYVNYNAELIDGNYEISYTFADHYNNLQTYNLSIPAEQTNIMINNFGIPVWLFEPYVDNEANREYRQQIIAKGLFRLNQNIIEVDKSAVLDYYSATFAKPIAEMIVSSLNDYGTDNRRNRIEFAMRFIQDIPYGVPEYDNGERHYGGVNIPPKLLIKGLGDCDSKVLLFVGILSYLIPAEDIIFLNQKDHVLSAVKELPDKGETYIKFRDEYFLIAETAGPGKRLLGQKGNYYRDKFTIETLNINIPEVLPFTNNKNQYIFTPEDPKPDKNILAITNESTSLFKFQISTDKVRWKNQTLNPNEEGRFIFDQRVTAYLRFYINRKKTATYKLMSGNSYSIYWNFRKKRWEISA